MSLVAPTLEPAVSFCDDAALNEASLHGLDLSSPPCGIDYHNTGTLRVLHVINGEHYAGAERVQDLLALRLPELGVHVGFACVKPNRFAAVRKSQAAPLTNLPMRSRFDLRPAWRLAKLLKAGRYDLLHTHTPRAAMVGRAAAAMAGVPLVHHVHGHTAVEVGRGWRTWLSAKTEQFVLSGAAAVIAVSHTAAQYIHAGGVTEEKIRIVPNGVPGRDEFVRRRANPKQWTLGTVALFRPRKGLEVLLEALSQLHRRGLPVSLHIIGGFETREYEEQVRRLTAELGIEKLVAWLGFRQDIDAELDALDLMILPSVLAEGMPMVVLEAMAAGVPPVGTRVAGIADVIHHGRDGLLCEPSDATSLADAVTAVITGQHDWQSLSAGALQTHSAKHSDLAMAAGVAEVYRAVLEPRAKDSDQ